MQENVAKVLILQEPPIEEQPTQQSVLQPQQPQLQHQPQPQRLYVDGLNFSSYIFTSTDFWNFENSKQNITDFVTAARNSGWHVEVFIDSQISTEETFQKWKTRRESCIRECIQGVPQGLKRILGEIYDSLEVPVNYSLIDNDDTLAAYAEKHGAAILSRDQDFFRYINHTYQIFFKYEILEVPQDDGSYMLFLELYESIQKLDRIIEPRELIMDPLPSTLSEAEHHQKYKKGINERSRRGNPSALTKYTGNLHALLKPLRQGIYYLTVEDPTKATLEIYPFWDNEANDVKWSEEILVPDKKFAYMLQEPDSINHAISYFINDVLISRPSFIPGNSLEWQNQLYAFVAIIAEMKQMIPDERGYQTEGHKIYPMFIDTCKSGEDFLIKHGLRIPNPYHDFELTNYDTLYSLTQMKATYDNQKQQEQENINNNPEHTFINTDSAAAHESSEYLKSDNYPRQWNFQSLKKVAEPFIPSFKRNKIEETKEPDIKE